MHGFAKLALSLFLLAFMAPLLHGQNSAPATKQSPAIRVSSNLVYVGVSVTDGTGHFIPGLRQKDFEILDNGVPQPIAEFVSDEDPAQVVLLIEDSSMDWLMAQLHRSLLVDADALVARIPAQDRVAILTYSKRTEIVSDFTSDKDVTRGALRELNAELGQGGALSSSLDLSASLYDTLNWLSTSPGAKTIVLFSSGFDSTTPDHRRAIHQRLAASDVRIIAISVFGGLRVPQKFHHISQEDRDDRAFVKEGITSGDDSLRQLALANGGRAYFPKTIKEFNRDCLTIGELVRGQYTLAFVPTTFDGHFHSISVKLKHHYFVSHVIEHRQGYIASPPSSN